MESGCTFTGFGLALGIAAGAALGSATHQIQVWLLLGAGIGLAVGVALRDRKQTAGRANTEQKSIRS
jgi:uncharacterized protein YfiM (DUF2279 family)